MGAQAVRLSNVDIDRALAERDFEVQFQPIFDLGNGALARMESFVRWRHHKLGLLPPGAFISFFENQGRMGDLTRYVFEEALAHYGKWRGRSGPGFSVNVAHADILDETLADDIAAMLKARRFPADFVTVECPVPLSPEDYTAYGKAIARLRAIGVRLAIEVRGRASDYLETVDPFPFDEIKTGGAAILRFAKTVRGPGLTAISELLDIARRSGASITAVGVEDQASLAALNGLGFSAAQGNYLGKVGGLSDFRSAQVNKVRENLEMDPLSPTALQDLFRTDPASLGAAAQDEPQQRPKKPEPASDKPAKAAPAPAKSRERKTPAPQEDVAARARRKAALLAQRRGKSALKAEIAARRKRLGLPTGFEADPVSEARNMQERLSTAFVDTHKAEKQSDRQDQRATDQATASAARSEVSPAVAIDDSGAPIVAAEGDTPQISADADAAAQADAPAPTLRKAEAPEQAAPDASDTPMNTAQEPSPSLDDGDDEPLVAPVGTATDTPADPFPALDLPQRGPATPLSAAPEQPAYAQHQARLSIAGAGAHFIDTLHVITNLSDDQPVAPEKPAAIDDDGLVTVELEAPAPADPASQMPSSPPAPNREQKEEAMQRNRLMEISDPETRPGQKQTSSPLGDLDDAESYIEGTTIDPQPAPLGSIADDQGDLIETPTPTQTTGTDHETRERAFIAASVESEILDDEIPDERTLMDRLPRWLTRKYRIMPTHFWPRAWRRAWDRRQANRDLVRRARQAARRLAESSE